MVAAEKLGRWEKEFILDSALGPCANGYRFRALNRTDRAVYEVRKLSDKPVEELLREVRNLRALDRCSGVTRFYSAWTEEKDVFIQLEYCEVSLAEENIKRRASEGDRDRAPASGVHRDDRNDGKTQGADDARGGSAKRVDTTWSEREIMVLLYSACQGLAEIHREGYIHGGLTQHAIFTAAEAPPPPLPKPVTASSITGNAQTGFHHSVARSKYKIGNFSSMMKLGEITGATLSDMPLGRRGFQMHAPPEFRNAVRSTGRTEHARGLTGAMDVYSLGMSLLDIINEKLPPPHAPEWKEFRSGGLVNSVVPGHFSPVLHAILRQMLHYDPSQRPTAAVVMDVLKFFHLRASQDGRKKAARQSQTMINAPSRLSGQRSTTPHSREPPSLDTTSRRGGSISALSGTLGGASVTSTRQGSSGGFARATSSSTKRSKDKEKEMFDRAAENHINEAIMEPEKAADKALYQGRPTKASITPRLAFSRNTPRPPASGSHTKASLQRHIEMQRRRVAGYVYCDQIDMPATRCFRPERRAATAQQHASRSGRTYAQTARSVRPVRGGDGEYEMLPVTPDGKQEILLPEDFVL